MYQIAIDLILFIVISKKTSKRGINPGEFKVSRRLLLILLIIINSITRTEKQGRTNMQYFYLFRMTW